MITLINTINISRFLATSSSPFAKLQVNLAAATQNRWHVIKRISSKLIHPGNKYRHTASCMLLLHSHLLPCKFVHI